MVRVEKTRTNYFGLLAVRTALEKRAFEWVVKKPLGRVQTAGDYMRLRLVQHLRVSSSQKTRRVGIIRVESLQGLIA